jgi:hypothetical protein
MKSFQRNGLATKKSFYQFDDGVFVLQRRFLSTMLERLPEYLFHGTSKCKIRDHAPLSQKIAPAQHPTVPARAQCAGGFAQPLSDV